MNSLSIIPYTQELITRRTSIRTYDLSTNINKEIDLMSEFITQLPASPFQGSTRFEIIQLEGRNKLQKLRLGTYGFVKRAENLLIGIITKPTFYDLENIGFLFECLILFATKLGLGTVWLGGTFSRKAFFSHLNLCNNERIPVISPVGRIASKQTLRSKAIKSIAKSKTRKPWSKLFFERDFITPLVKDAVKEFATPLEMVRLAPSASNFQPWRIIKIPDENIFHFYIYRRSPRSHRILNWPDLSRIDLGIAVCHFDLTVRQMNLSGEWRFEYPSHPVKEDMEYLLSWVSS